jgi:hypothetical protein
MANRRWLLMILTAGACLAAATCGDGSPNGPAPTCSYTLSPASQTVAAEGGPATVTITAAAGCAWTATSSVPWVTVSSGASGSGSGSVVLAVSANAAADARAVSLSIATQPFLLTQAGRPAQACTYALEPASVDITKDAASGVVTITAPAGCPWSAASSASWLLLTSNTEGSGTGTVAYAAAGNPDTTPRTGTITIAGRSFTLRQQGDLGNCQYTVTPVDFSPCMSATTLRVQITTASACPWRAAPTTGWLGLDRFDGAGTATIDIAVGENYDAPRSGVVEVRWDTPTAGQNVRVAQAGCLYGVSRDAFAFTTAGGAGTFDVVQQSVPNTCGGATQDRCLWTAVSDVPWITITSSMPRTGDNPVAFTVAANTGAARTGRITVRDRVVSITQAGQ